MSRYEAMWPEENDMTRPTLKTFTLPALGALVLLLGLSGCGGGEAPTATAGTPAQPISVRTAEASLQAVASTITATGSVQPSRRALPGTKILGRAAAVPVREGERVTTGQLLVRLDDRDLRAAVAQAEAAVTMAEAQRENARAQHERMQTLLERGAVTAKNLEDATAAFRTADAAVAQAEANLEAARVTLSYARVASPFAGWVSAKHVEIGDMVAPGQPLFVIEDMDPAKIVAEIPEQNVAALTRESETPALRIEVDALGLTLDATLERLLPAADSRARTFQLQARVANPDGRLKSGMFVRVEVPAATTLDQQALFVPASALVRRGQLDGLYVVADGHARLRWVRIGGSRDGSVEVLSGLEAGEHYVVAPPATLTDGAPVTELPVAAQVGRS